MTGHKLFTLAALALLAVACNREAISPDMEQRDEVIDFSAFFAQDATKAVGEKTSLVAADTMGVFACYTGAVKYDLSSVSPDFMYNQKVTYDGSNWAYSPVKYWPNNSNEYISFFSYYPYVSSEKAAKAEDGIIGFSNANAKGDPWLVFKLPKGAPVTQTDLLYGTPQFDQVKKHISGDESKVKFQLNHALACIADTVTVQMTQALYEYMHSNSLDITITGFRIVYSNLTTKARLVLNSTGGQPNWREVISGELLTSRMYKNEQIDTLFSSAATSNPDPQIIDCENGLFYIPMQIAGQPLPQAEITLAYTVCEHGGSVSIKDAVSTVVSFEPGGPGKRQHLALHLTDLFNLQADIVTYESGGISMPTDLAATDKDVKIDYEIKPDTLTFTGAVQTYTIPRTGTYLLKAWGAQGGKGTYDGAKGGDISAKFNFSMGDVLYVYVGGKGEDATTSSGGNGGWNGGGRGGNPDGGYPGGGGGGGATHIAASAIGEINSSSNPKLSAYIGLVGDLLLVAGGGGGGSWKADSAGAGGGDVGNKGHNGTPTYLADWNNGDFSYGAIGGPGGYPADGGGREGNGGGGGGYLGGSARTSPNVTGSGSAYGGSGGSSKANIERYNYDSGVATSSGVQEGDGQVKITFKQAL